MLHALCVPFHRQLHAASHEDIIASIIFCLLVEVNQVEGSEYVNLKVINVLNQVVLLVAIEISFARKFFEVACGRDALCEYSCTDVCVYSGGDGATPCDGG